MRNFVMLSFFTLSWLTHAQGASIKGAYCGTRGSFLGTLASEIAIPDYFPPEKILARFFLNPLFGDMALCEEEHEAVYLGNSCRLHDECYTTIGATKDSCDEQLLSHWQQACAKGYLGTDETSSYCRNTCETFTRFMFDAMRYDDGSFCPSCRAFEIDQEKARQMSLYND